MTSLLKTLCQDEAGFIVSAELILISTVAVLAMVVGLSEVSRAINQELNDVASAFGSVNQSFRYQGLTGHGGALDGSTVQDGVDFCDRSSLTPTAPAPEET